MRKCHKYHKWTTQEEQWLIENYPKLGGKLCVEHLNIPYDTLIQRCIKLNLTYIHPGTWTQAEIDYLIKNYSQDTVAKCAIFLNRKPKSIRAKACSLKLTKAVSPRWTQKEIDYLKANYIKLKSKGCSKYLNRSLACIRGKANELGLKYLKKWTSEEINYLKENYPKIGARACANFLNKTYHSVTCQARFLHLKSPIRAAWTTIQINQLKQFYPDYGCEYCSKLLGVSIHAISSMASRFKLKRNPPITPSQKKCKCCKIIKPIAQFNKTKRNYKPIGKKYHPRYGEGYDTLCQICRKESNRLKGRKSYYSNHKKTLAKIRKYTKNRRATDINYHLSCILRSRVKEILKGRKVNKTMDLIGCSVIEARKHLEAQFKPGMAWKNYGLYGWHVDHIRPFASFDDLNDPVQQRAACHYTNLQPLWATTAIARAHGDMTSIGNLEKGDKYTPPASKVKSFSNNLHQPRIFKNVAYHLNIIKIK